MPANLPTALEQRLVELRQLAASTPAEVLAELLTLRPQTALDPRLESLADCTEARAHLQLGDLRRSLGAAARAERGATAAGARDMVGAARHVTGQLFGGLGHHRAALEAFDGALAALDGVDARQHLAARIDRAGQLRASKRLGEAAAEFDVLVHHADVPAEWRLVLEINAASCWHQVGRVDDAARALGRIEGLLDASGRADLRAWWHAIAAWVEAASGRPVPAGTHARRALAGAMPTDLLLRGSAGRALALAAQLPGAPPELATAATDVLDPLVGETVEAGLLGLACDIHETLANLAGNDLVRTVRHLRERDRVRERQRSHDDLLRLQAEDMRLELVRLELEAERLRSGAAALEDANRLLEGADAARRQLLHSVAHDVRGLVTALMIGTEMLNPEEPLQLAERKRALIDAATRMWTLVDRALSDQSIGTGVTELVREPIDLRGSLRSLLGTFAPLAVARGQSLELVAASPIAASCDPVALARIIDNLVGNALKYTPAGGRILVRAEQAEAEVRVVVEDDGPGFPTNDPQRALLLGERLGADVAGRGIGLHVVYDLVSRLGGVVEVGNRPAGGAQLVVRLPRHQH